MKEFNYAMLDIESVPGDWSRMNCAVLLTEHGEVSVFRNQEDLRRAVEAFPGKIFSHWGGGFDFLFLMPLQSVRISQSLVTCAQLGKAWLHDLSRLMPVSLAEIGKSVGIPKLNRSDALGGLTQAELERHCTRDCEIGIVALKEFFEWIQLAEHPNHMARAPCTAGIAAIHLMEALEPQHVLAMAPHVLDPMTWSAMNSACSGARTEAFHVGYVDEVYAYDRRSAYPAAWLEGSIPVGPWRVVNREVANPGVYWCSKIKQSRRHLPLVAVDERWSYKGEGWLTSEEIAAVRELGGDVKVERGWATRHILPLGQDVVRHVYPFKQAGKPWGKSILNQLHGKYVQKIQNEIWYHTRQGYKRDEEMTLPVWYQQPLVTAFLYARARLELGRIANLLRARGWAVYYIDTDCIHTNCPPREFPGILGPGCGDWRIIEEDSGLRAEQVEACYVAPKLYGLRDDMGRTKIACRGVSPDLVSWDNLLNACKGDEIEIQEDAGVKQFRGLIAGIGWGMEGLESSRTIRVQTGQKERQEDGSLIYPKD